MDKALYIPTPLIPSTPLSRVIGEEVWLKVEALQPIGSFKIRGFSFLCQEFFKQGFTHFVSSSGGNAGLAAAYAGKKLKIPVTVVVPTSCSTFAKQLIQAEGARVIAHGDQWSDADLLAREMAEKTQAAYLPPFDHPLIWKGNATMIEEVAKSGLVPDVVILAVGGGGLLCGVCEGMEAAQWGHVPIYAVETEGAASFRAAVKAGRVVDIGKIDTVAKTLGSPWVTEKALEWAQKRPIISKIVSDSSAVKACARFLDDHRLLVEPSCGTALSLLYDELSELQAYKKILVIVCGGAGVNDELLSKWKQEYAPKRSPLSTPYADEDPDCYLL